MAIPVPAPASAPDGSAPPVGAGDPVPLAIAIAERDLLPPGTPIKRRTRDWIIDSLCFLLAILFGVLTYADAFPDGVATDALAAVDLVVGVAACLSVWLRRRWPVQLAVVLGIVSSFVSLSTGAAAVAVFTVVLHRTPRVAMPVVALNLASACVYMVVHPDDDMALVWQFALTGVIVAAIVGWAMAVRARRQLILSLRDRALRAESEQQLQVTQARDHERARIAREMHDVLAHRISLLSMHAGALEFRPDATPEEVARAAGVIRSSAHQALEDLREVIGVLRGSDEAGAREATSTTRPQPTLDDVPALLAESRAAGMRIRERIEVADGPPPASVGRNAYRVVQEGLTNARKHAAGAVVEVTVSGSPAAGLTIEIRNPTPVGVLAPTGGAGAAGGLPGSGTGIIGLAERATLAGGRLDHGPTADGGFRLRAWFPWPH
ncbi:sensor histidine kinase [Patulibacter defluvii]|uniref:sensor histidine kinase n=1 Tax=Patulibacter defluvii TaxID=3095358 RepID=UPI002A75C508|nr:histidine kinase [Patulibacter sp. DM4]